MPDCPDCDHPQSLHASYGGCYVMVCRCHRDRTGIIRDQWNDDYMSLNFRAARHA